MRIEREWVVKSPTLDECLKRFEGNNAFVQISRKKLIH